MTAEALLTLISHLSLLVSTLILCLIGKSMVGVIRLMRKGLWELRGLERRGMMEKKEISNVD